MVDDAVERMRRAGRKYLAKKPGAFGGGIDPKTGIRYKGGRRVSVGTPEEIKAGVVAPTLAEARAISKAPSELKLLKAGGIRVGGITYRGGSVVPFSGGKTANQLRRQVFKQARGEGITKMGTFSARIPIEEKYLPRKEVRKIIRQPRKLIPVRPLKAKGELKPTLLPKVSLKKIKAGTVEAMDVVSGGYFTERRIDKRQEKINQDVDAFNKKYGGKELTESQYKEAIKVSKDLETRETQVTKDRDKLASSMRSKAYGRIFKTMEGRRLTSKEKAEKIERNAPRVKKLEEEQRKTEEKIKKFSKKRDIVSKVNIRRLKAIKTGTQEEIDRLKAGKSPEIFAGEFPIIPAVQIPAGVTAIKFVGTQKKAKGGKIITDIVFQTSKGQMGVAKGVSVAKGKKGTSIVLGRTGKRVFKLPSGKQKIIQLETFMGAEKTLTIPSKITLQRNIDILKGAKKTGIVGKIKKNIDVMKQAGIGRVGSVKGKKLMKSGKAVKGIMFDDFASISAMITKKDLSLIVGKSVTGVGAKSKFIGIIKGTSKAGKGTFKVGGKGGLTAVQQKQYKKALQKVISATAGALTKTKKVGKLPKATALVLASKLAVAEAKPTKKITPKMKPKTKPKVKPIVKPTQKPKPTITGAVTTTKKRSKKKIAPVKTVKLKKSKKTKKVRVKRLGLVKPKAVRVSPASRKIRAQKIKSRQKEKQRAKQRAKAKSLAKTKAKARTKTLQAKAKQVTRKKPTRAKAKPKGIRAPRVPKIPRLKKDKKKKAKRKARPTPKKVQAYSVYARPLKKRKGKGRPKLVKVNKVPLRKNRAKDVRNYLVDTSLSGTGRIRKTRGKPKGSRLKVPSGYAKRTSKKFRRHEKVKGKRKLLPKGKVIERKRRRLDTKGEKNSISLRRRIKQITKPRKKAKRPTPRSPVKSKQKVTGAKRTQMLDNLAKARKVRMSNLKKKKR